MKFLDIVFKALYRAWRCRPTAFRCALGLTCLLPLWIAFAACAAAQQQRGTIWLTGVDPIGAQHRNWPEPNREDYAGMFFPDAPWQRAAQDVKVFKMTAGVVLRMPEDVVARIFADLKRRHMALAMEMEILGGQGGCGVGVAGYAARGTFAVAASKVKKLGGDLRYVAMDEPLWFGHRYDGRNACKAPIRDIAQEVARAVGILKQIFPEIEVGDIEPIGNPTAKGWLADIAEWLRAYRDEVGEPMPFFHADITWNGPWREQLRDLATTTRSAKIRLGIIYNGDAQEESDEAWTHHAQQHIEEVETGLGLVPDDAILQTWMPRPFHMLPETRAGTMTYLVNRYAAAPTVLSARRDHETLVGGLADDGGRPMASNTIEITATDSGTAPMTKITTFGGNVPDGATHATVALRINTGCNCSGPAEVSFGPMWYEDGTTGQRVQRVFAEPRTGRISARAGEALGQNSPAFDVIQGHPYTLRVPMAASYNSKGNGYVAIIFLDQRDTQIANNKVWFAPSQVTAGHTTTDAGGNFRFLPPPGVLSLHAGYIVEFPGDEQHRMSELYVP
jgi:hypothetical protein